MGSIDENTPHQKISTIVLVRALRTKRHQSPVIVPSTPSQSGQPAAVSNIFQCRPKPDDDFKEETDEESAVRLVELEEWQMIAPSTYFLLAPPSGKKDGHEERKRNKSVSGTAEASRSRHCARVCARVTAAAAMMVLLLLLHL